MSEPIQLSASESRLILHSIGTELAHLHRALQACQQAPPSRQMLEGIREREQQISRFEKLREKIGEQL